MKLNNTLIIILALAGILCTKAMGQHPLGYLPPGYNLYQQPGYQAYPQSRYRAAYPGFYPGHLLQSSFQPPVPSPTASISDAAVPTPPASEHAGEYIGEYGNEYGSGYAGKVPGCNDCCYRSQRVFASLEYLLWFGQGRSLPTLLTTSPQGTLQNVAGLNGQSTTSVLFGGEQVGDGLGSGGRYTLGFWVGKYEEVAVGIRFFNFETEHAEFIASSNGNPIIARPFFNEQTNAEDAVLVAFPGLNDNSSINIQSTTDVNNGDVFIRIPMARGHGFRYDLFGGYQFTRINDDLYISHSFQDDLVGNGIPDDTITALVDSIDVRNDFHGGAVGVLAEYRNGCHVVRFFGKLGVGNMREQVTIRGQTSTTEPGQPTNVDNFGHLAQPSNSGTYKQDKTTLVPEAEISMIRTFGSHFELFAGYNFIYWSNVARAGDQVDTRVNPSQNGPFLVGDLAPLFEFRDTDFWAQGVNLGLRCNY